MVDIHENKKKKIPGAPQKISTCTYLALLLKLVRNKSFVKFGLILFLTYISK